MKDFFVILTSGSNQEKYQNNPSKFRNDLPVPLELKDGWEFGVCQMSFVPDIDNIKNVKGALHFYDHLHEWIIQDYNVETGVKLYGKDGYIAFHEKEEPMYAYLHTKLAQEYDTLKNTALYGMEGSIDVQGGFFESQSELCSCLNVKLWEQIPRLKGMEIFSYVKPLRRFSISTEGHHLTIYFKNDEFADFLGANTEFRYGLSRSGPRYKYQGVERKYSDSDERWTTIPDGLLPKASYFKTENSLMIYSKLTRDQTFGSSYSSLIAMCHIDGLDGKRILKNFDQIHYCPINKQFIPSLNLHIKLIDDSFAQLKDITFVKLHFRLRREKQ